MQEHKQEDVRTNGNCCFNHIIRLPKKTFMAIMSNEHDNNKMRLSNSRHKNSMPYMEATL